MRTISEQRQTQVKSLGNLVDMLGDKTLARQLNEKVTKTVEKAILNPSLEAKTTAQR